MGEDVPHSGLSIQSLPERRPSDLGGLKDEVAQSILREAREC